MPSELENFDWLNHKGLDMVYERKLKILRGLSDACSSCNMCELGLKNVARDKESGDFRDPHVFSNLNPKRFMVVGQNPGWTELGVGVPLVGEAGVNFDVEIERHKLSRDDFYICNACRCFTPGNTRPEARNLEACRPYLEMEIRTIKPKLVVALGGVAFEQLCPGVPFSESLKKITKSKKYDGVPVFPVYHPSPVNLDEGGKRKDFEEQIALMCGLVKALRAKLQAG